MREKLVRKTLLLAHAAQQIGTNLNPLSGPCEKQIPSASQEAKQIVGHWRRYPEVFAASIDLVRFGVSLHVLGASRSKNVAADLQSNAIALIVAFDQADLLPPTRPENFGGQKHVAQRRRETDTVNSLSAGTNFNAVENRLQLHATLCTDEGMQLIHNHRLKCRKQVLCLGTTSDKHGLQ
ncbi:hypothetical protein D9M70_458660 [compost metagenome]